MPDQAEHLRQLIHVATPGVCAKPRAEGTPLVVVTGSSLGVGATTVAVNLGVVLASRAARVLVVDAVEERSNLAEIAGIRSATSFSLSDAPAATRDVAEAIVAGPSGIEILTWRNRTRHEELLPAWKSLERAFDIIVIDAGPGLSRLARRLWLHAHLVLLVATSADAAVMDAYATVKRHVVGVRGTTCANIRLLLNQVESDRAAGDSQRRLMNCCQRFLRQKVAAMPALPRWEDCEDASIKRHPRVWEAPNTEFGHAVLWLGRAVEDALVIEGGKCRVQGNCVSSFPASRVPHPAPC